jgi:hypothetical protein
MGTNKAKPAGTPKPAAPWIRFLLRPQNRGLVLCALVVIVSGAGVLYAWQRWGQPAMRSAEYVVTPERINVNALPAWIRSDVKAEVIRSAGITQLDLRENKLLEKVSHAFALHPWVAKVVRIEKRFPARVEVELLYRRPAAVVEIVPQGKNELLFVDDQSVLLPSTDFSPSQAKDYLRIAAGNETTASVYGMPWGSRRIAGAARLAALWGDRWKPLGLYRIVTVESAAGQVIYELRTPRDVRIIWGSAAISESAREPSAEQKIAALEQLVHDKGPLDREGAQAVVDLRQLAGPTAKTAGTGKTSPR